MKFEKFNITLLLPVEQVNQLSALTRLYNDHRVSEGHCASFTECSYLEQLLGFQLGRLLSDELDYYQRKHSRLSRNTEAGDVPARNPSREAGPDEPDADREEEALVFSVTEGNMIHDALFDAGQRVLARRFPHTWTYPVEDESLFNAVWEGDTPMTLTEEERETIVSALYARAFSKADAGYMTISDELFNLARRICGDDAREEEPETLISVRDASGVVRMVTLDEMEEMREAAQGIYAGEPPEPQDEPDEPDEDGEEKEPETVSNALKKPSPLIKDNSDGYFYYLEHGHWPPDDEIIAYELSDCLVMTQSVPDFVDAFFVGQEAGA